MKRAYIKFNYPNATPTSTTVLTGIKRKNKTEYYITGIYISILPDITFIYKGSLDGKGTYYTLSFSSSLPIIETNLFGPVEELGNNIRVAGTCTIERGIGREKIRVGCYYQGPLDNTGIWNTIIIPLDEKINDIVAHDTNGGLVVGNYNVLDQWKSYIYDINNNKYFYIVNKNVNNIVTYGILKISKHDYIICGSCILNVKEVAYIVDWNNKKRQLSNWRTFIYNNDPDVSVTRFNCVSPDKKNYVLTGYYTIINKTNGFIAYLNNDTIKWESIEFPGANIIRGNSIDDNILVGIYDDKHAFISI